MNEECYAQINKNKLMQETNEMFDARYFNAKQTLMPMNVMMQMNEMYHAHIVNIYYIE